jgi:hypothetical protein
MNVHLLEAAFDDAECTVALKREKMYRAGCNFFWLNMFRSLMPGVPLSMERIMEIVVEYFATPVPFKGMVTVEGRADANLPRTSNLLILSPEEFCHAYLLAIDAAISRGDSDDILQTWKKFCLSVCFEYIDVAANGPNATFWWAWNNREQHCVSSDAVKRTAYQRACEVYNFKVNLLKAKAPATADAIAKAYSDSVTSKKLIDVSFVRECLTVYEKVCLNPDITAVIDRLEQKYKIESCLNSLGKLQKIVEKCDTLQHRVLVFHAIEDSIERGINPNSKFTREFLTGGHKDSGSSIPFVQLVIFRWRLRTHILTIEMPREKMNPQDIQRIADMTADYQKQRAMDSDDADTTWIGAMSPSSVLAYRVIQALVKHKIDLDY